MISTVKKWIPDRGYGFIVHPEGGRDLFVHFSEILQRAGERARTSLEIGEAVEFDLADGPKGEVAKRVRPLTSHLSPLTSHLA